jgi:hypothetical protein
MADERGSPTPAEQVARLYEQAESEAAKASERLVGSQGFASLLGQMAENAAALTKLTNDAMDLVLRNMRVAGRRDVIRLARQLGRTEDKLERVLQELEEVRDQLGDRDGSGAGDDAAHDSGPARSSGATANGAPAGGSAPRESGQPGGATGGGEGHSDQPPEL